MGKSEYLSHRERREHKEGSELIQNCVHFVSLIYWCLSVRAQRTASSPQDALALLNEKGWKGLTPVSLIQFNRCI